MQAMLTYIIAATALLLAELTVERYPKAGKPRVSSAWV
jgi:hypothetical protein